MSTSAQKRRLDPAPDELNTLSLSDNNFWYYPSHGHDSDDEEIVVGGQGGNWGQKTARGARWVRRGKITSWGPGIDDWESEERARKRVKQLLPQPRRSPSPPSLPHLRSPSPPLVSPYPPPTVQHLNYSSFVLDKAVTNSFRSSLLEELEQATSGLIESEATLRRALGKSWQVISEDPDKERIASSFVPKREDEDEDVEDQRLARAPDLTPPAHKLFLLLSNNGGPPVVEPSQFASPEMQMESLEKSLANLRELQDDGREYLERLQEIRDGLACVIAQRKEIWDMVREKAVKEFQDAAMV